MIARLAALWNGSHTATCLLCSRALAADELDELCRACLVRLGITAPDPPEYGGVVVKGPPHWFR